MSHFFMVCMTYLFRDRSFPHLKIVYFLMRSMIYESAEYFATLGTDASAQLCQSISSQTTYRTNSMSCLHFSQFNDMRK